MQYPNTAADACRQGRMYTARFLWHSKACAAQQSCNVGAQRCRGERQQWWQQQQQQPQHNARIVKKGAGHQRHKATADASRPRQISAVRVDTMEKAQHCCTGLDQLVISTMHHYIATGPHVQQETSVCNERRSIGEVQTMLGMRCITWPAHPHGLEVADPHEGAH